MAEGEYVSPYSPCTLIMPDGKVARNKSVRTIRLMPADRAVTALRSNKAAWIAPGDEEMVLAGLAGMV